MASGAIAEWLSEHKNRRTVPHRLERCGYISVKNPDAKDGYWKIGTRQPVYAKALLPAAARLAAARKLADNSNAQ